MTGASIRKQICITPRDLAPVPHASDSGVSHLLLQLEDTVHQSLGGRRA